ncbi:MAG: helical backbone metal receptor [Thermodesulfobacteriota bacterium]
MPGALWGAPGSGSRENTTKTSRAIKLGALRTPTLALAVLLLFSALSSHARPEGRPLRIISLAPSITEALYAIGAQDLIVGVGDFCDYPPESKKLPRVGGYLDPNLERFISLTPDLVIVSGRHEKVDAFCQEQNIRVLHLAIDNIAGIYTGIRKLGELTGRQSQAESLCEKIRTGLSEVARKSADAPRRKVFVCINRAPGSLGSVYTAGRKSFLSEILAMAGGENIFDDVTLPYPEASKESILVRAPDVILDLRPGEDLSENKKKRLASDWEVLRNVPAVRNHRVFVLTENFLMLPGPRVVNAARTLADYLNRDGGKP